MVVQWSPKPLTSVRFIPPPPSIKINSDTDIRVFLCINRRITDEVEFYKDEEGILAMGIMGTPTLVIDKKIYSTGRVLNAKQAKELLSKALGTCTLECCSNKNNINKFVALLKSKVTF
jgi:hypothetical protein